MSCSPTPKADESVERPFNDGRLAQAGGLCEALNFAHHHRIGDLKCHGKPLVLISTSSIYIVVAKLTMPLAQSLLISRQR